MDKELIDRLEGIIKRLDLFEKVVNVRIDKLKKVVGDYLELSSNISMASVKANLKSV